MRNRPSRCEHKLKLTLLARGEGRTDCETRILKCMSLRWTGMSSTISIDSDDHT